MSAAFTPRRVQQLRPTIQRLMDALVDEVAGAGEIDLLAALAEPLPVAVIDELLEYPRRTGRCCGRGAPRICGMYELLAEPRWRPTYIIGGLFELRVRG